MAIIRKLGRPPEEHTPSWEKPARQRFNRDHDDANWLISYADMMTLLCVFYIMMFSMATVNSAKFEAMKKQVAEHFGTKYESPTQDLGKFINNVLVETGAAKDATMTSDGVSVTLAFHSTLFFDTMSAEISNEGKAILSKIMTGLDAQQAKSGKKYKIVVEGHTDSQPILAGPFPSNWELSSSRATRVVRLFLEHGFSPANLLAIGYADTQPVAVARNADGSWNEQNLAKNRRVVLRVLLPEVDSIPWQGKNENTRAPSSVAAGASATSAVTTPAVPANPAGAAPVTPAANPVK